MVSSNIKYYQMEEKKKKVDKKKQQSSASHLEFIDRLNKYIPSLVLQQLLSKQQTRESTASQNEIKLPELQSMETAVMFADISGFTNLSEACAKGGFRGNENLAFCINRYLECMIKSLQKYGGDIIKFVGDAMIIMWPEIDINVNDMNASSKFSESRINHVDIVSYQRQLTVRKAVQCALEMQNQLNNMQIMPGIKLSVKIGIGYGQCALLYVGGVFHRTEFFSIGDSLSQALASEGMCERGGQIVVSNQAYKHVRDYFTAVELTDSDKQTFYRVSKLSGQSVKIRADANLLRNEIMKQFQVSTAVDKLQACVPAAIVPYLRIDEEAFGASNRSLTVMFASLGVELSSAETETGLHHIQKIVTTVQEQVYRLQGSLNKLVMDDKGSTLICLWGLSPFSHEDDATRAILTAFNIIKELKKIDTWCNIGISSGECFSGVVGTAGARKEFSVLGDVANLAARIMGSLKYQRNAIACDQKTRILCQNQFTFNYGGHKEFKGKSISMPVFVPIDPSIQLEKASQGVLPYNVFLQPHMNRLDIRGGVIEKFSTKTFGFEKIIEDIKDEMTEFFEQSSPLSPYLLTIKGQIGQGKTIFVMNLLEELQKTNFCQDYTRLFSGLQMPILVGNINPESDLSFLNMWRPILRQLLTHYSKQKGIPKSKVVNVILNSTSDISGQANKRDIVCEILGLTPQEKQELAEDVELPIVEQIKPKPSMFAFVQRPEYQDQDREDIIQMLYHLVKIAIGEAGDISDLIADLNGGEMSRTESSQSEELSSDDDQQPKEPFVIVLDNAQMMDTASWEMYEAIRDGCFRISIILMLQTDFNEDVKVHASCKATFDRIWQSASMEDNRVVELPNLNIKSLESMLLHNAQRYQDSYRYEARKMTQIEDPNTTIKDIKTSRDEHERLIDRWQLKTQFKNIDPRVLEVIQRNCGGNPLYCLQYFVNLIQDEFIEIRASDGMVRPKDKFLVCYEVDDWKSVQVPRLALKIICTYLDKYLWEVQTKKNKKAIEIDQTVKSIILMKTATVCSYGNDFYSNNLEECCSLQIQKGTLIKHLKRLEKADLIEIVDESDPKRVHCRFIHFFFKDALYQVMLYKGCKKDLHDVNEKLLQNMPIFDVPKDNDMIVQTLKLNMLSSQDVQSEDQLSFARRTGLTVRRLQNTLMMNSKGVLLKDYLYKQGEALNRKTEKRLVTMSAKELCWYHDEKEFEEQQPLGKITLEFIYNIFKSFQVHNDRPTFMLSVTMWTNKKGEDKGRREFFFSCDNEILRDKWMIAIDYLKTKAIYDAYTQRNRNIDFNIQQVQKNQQNEEHDNFDKDLLVVDFGRNLKQKTTMASGGKALSKMPSLQQQRTRMMRRRTSLNSQPVKIGRMSAVQREASKSTKVTRLASQGDLNELTSDYDASAKRFSFMRRMTSRLVVEDEQQEPTIKADELVSKLKLLYSAGVTGFMYHIQETACKTSEKQRNRNIGALNENIQDQYQDLVRNAILEDKLSKERRESEQIIKKKTKEQEQPEQRKSMLLPMRSFSGTSNEEIKQQQLTRKTIATSASRFYDNQIAQGIKTLKAIPEEPTNRDSNVLFETQGGDNEEKKEKLQETNVQCEDTSRRSIAQTAPLARKESLSQKQKTLPENLDQAAFKQKVIDALIKRTNEDEREVRNLQQEISESKKRLQEMESELGVYKSQKSPQNSVVLQNDFTRKIDSDQSLDYQSVFKLSDSNINGKEKKPKENPKDLVGIKGRVKECSIF